MKILITGGCGFVGTNLIRTLLATISGISVTNIDQLTYAANPRSLADYAGSDNYAFVHTDIAEPKRVDEVVANSAPDAIIHLAAESHVDRSIDDPTVFIQTNVVGTFNLLQSSLRYYQKLAPAQQSSFRFLHVSTDEVLQYRLQLRTDQRRIGREDL